MHGFNVHVKDGKTLILQNEEDEHFEFEVDFDKDPNKITLKGTKTLLTFDNVELAAFN